MAGWMLNILYLIVLTVAAPLLLWVDLRTHKYRASLWPRFSGRVPRRHGDNPCIWLHAVSVGEVQVLGCLVDRLQQTLPDADLVVSTGTATGYRLARKLFPKHLVCHGPLDFTWSVRRALGRLRPDVLVLTETELWPNLIRLAHRSGARLVLINGRLSDRSFRGYRRVRPWIGRMLKCFAAIGVQNTAYAQRYRSLGAPADRLMVTGSLKFDAAMTDRDQPAVGRLRKVAQLRDSDLVFLAGSTQAPEEELALDAFAHAAHQWPQLRLILVPRHPERFAEVAELLARSPWPWRRRSELGDGSVEANRSEHRTREPWRVLLVDTMGELAAWWGTADVGYVGGSMGTREGQNMLEPAGFGVATCFGPRTSNFRDIVATLREADAVRVVRDGAEMSAFLQTCLAEPSVRRSLGSRARRCVISSRGATQRTVDMLRNVLQQSRAGGADHRLRHAG